MPYQIHKIELMMHGVPPHSLSFMSMIFLFFSSKLHVLNPQLHLKEKKRKTGFMRRNTNLMISRQKKKREKEEIHIRKFLSGFQSASRASRPRPHVHEYLLYIAFFPMHCGHLFTPKLHLKSLKTASNVRIFSNSVLRIYTWMGKKQICKLPSVFS